MKNIGNLNRDLSRLKRDFRKLKKDFRETKKNCTKMNRQPQNNRYFVAYLIFVSQFCCTNLNDVIMKKNLKTIALAAFAAISIMVVGISLLNASSQKNILDVTLREVESLADIELPEVVIECGKVTSMIYV